MESMELVNGPFKKQIELDKQDYENLPTWMKNNHYK